MMKQKKTKTLLLLFYSLLLIDLFFLSIVGIELLDLVVLQYFDVLFYQSA